MAKVKTWVWVVAGIIGVGILGIVVLAGAGLWFVRSHFHVQEATVAAAASDFSTVRTRFSAQKPLIELDEHGEFIRANTDRPASNVPLQSLNIMAFNPTEGKVVRIDVPWWAVRLKSGGQRISLDGGDVDLARLRLTVEDLERFGPTLILDHEDRHGVRVLVWSQ